ncbi:MAG: FHA domain-containing protein [Nitrospirae bacterium]|nr:FHA domain-containing protein [Nitrospirota bacterium]
MVKLIKCVNGHFYDKSKTATCPHCEKIESILDPTASIFTLSGTSMSTASDVLSDDETSNSPIESTIPVFDSTAVEELDRQVFNPTTGWLIMLKGDLRGSDYRLKTGKNTIGRSKENHISIGTDRLMSRKHASLFYHPKINSFFIEDHSSHGTLLNGQPVLQRTGLKNMDVIEIGETKFLFKTLCDDDFMWEDFKKDAAV